MYLNVKNTVSTLNRNKMLEFRSMHSPALGIYNEARCSATEFINGESKYRLEVEIAKALREREYRTIKNRDRYAPSYMEDPRSFSQNNPNLYVVYVEVRPFHEIPIKITAGDFTGPKEQTNKNKLLLT